MNKEALLNVAKALRESPAPEKFTMRTLFHPCGTPACALGHYASRPDLQSVFQVIEGGEIRATPGGSFYRSVYMTELSHFDIDDEQEDKLFGVDGCDNAQTTEEAAQYIERFVAEHG